MGRLTLNVLLSFAQFEREVTSERIRDKIAASKRKGLWVGGMVPLGYETKDRKVTVNEDEAERVRTIFRSYLRARQPQSADGGPAQARDRHQGAHAQDRPDDRRDPVHPWPARPISSATASIIGEVVFKGEVLPGEQPAILDRELFEAVQVKLSEQQQSSRVSRTKSESLLTGRIFDDRGNRMTPSHARKRGNRYRYYLSSALSRDSPNVPDPCGACLPPRSRYSSHLLFASTSTNPIKPMTESSSMPMLLGSKSKRTSWSSSYSPTPRQARRQTPDGRQKMEPTLLHVSWQKTP